MKKTIKTETLLALYRLLSAAKCNKMDDADKIKVWKIQRAMKPVAEQFDDDVKSSGEKLRPEGFDEALQMAQKVEQDARKDFGDIDTPQREREFVEMLISENKEYAKFQEQNRNYVKVCNDAVREFADKDVELDYEPLTEDALSKLISSNDWTLGQVSFIADYVCQ